MSDSFNPARRDFLVSGALAAGGLSLGAGGLGNAVAAPPQGSPLNELGYAQVQFDDGPLDRQARENHRLVLGLNEDALLRPFRVRGGRPAAGPELGGWYDTYAFAPGATFGQWVCALSRYYAITGDAATRAKVQRLIRGYAATVDVDGLFYRNNRFPSYTYDKLAGAMIEARQLTRDDAALSTLQRTTQAAEPYLPPHAMPRNEHALPGEDFSQHAWDESYTIPENQFLAWRLTGDSRHRALALRFVYDDFFMPLARGENVLPGKHAYSHVNGLSSAAQAYLTLGKTAYLDAARNGFVMIDAQSFATGGWGPDEHFVEPDGGGLGASLVAEHKSFETPCGAYAHFKLTRYLLRITRDSRYGDSMERVLYNTVLGAKPIQPDGHAFYYSDYSHQARKAFHPDLWPCCSGTLPMIAADYRISTCFADPQGLYVNLYVPAQVTWRQGSTACRLSIQTEYPHASAIAITVQTPTPQTFAINLRIPAWAQGASVAINGRRGDVQVNAGRFARIHREWRSGDRIELSLPLPLRLEAVDAQHPHTLALLSGPVVLMRLLEDATATSTPLLTRAALLSARPQSGNPQRWQASAGASSIELRPFTAIDNEAYRLYQDVTPSGA